MAKILHYVDGSWTSSPSLSFFDLSVIRGYGVFDFLRTYDHMPFKLNEHIDRLYRSAQQLGITVPLSQKKIVSIVSEGIAKNNLSDYNIRIVVTGGITPDGISVPDKSSLAILFSEAKNYPDSYYSQGVKIVAREHERVFPTAKTLNYLTAISALSDAKKKHAVEVLYIDRDNRILEGTTSNFFAVINGRLITPKDQILIGITRNVVLEIAQQLKIPVIETDLLYSQIELFDEAFITASNKEVMPVVRIDDATVGNGNVGQVTKQIIDSYRLLLGK